MGAMHAQLLAGLPGVDEILVVEPDPVRADEVAAATGARPVSLPEAVDAADAMVVASPAEFHAVAVEAAVAAGMPTLCEKPLTADLASSAALLELVERADAHVELGFQRRHDAGFAEAHRRLTAGEVGRIELLRLTAFDPRGPRMTADAWPETAVAPIFLHSSVHDFDLARWLTGSEVAEVTAIGSHRGGGRAADPREIETAVVTMRMASGTLAVLEASWLDPLGYDVRAEIIGERDALTIGLSGRTPINHLDWPGAADAEPWPGYLERFTDAYRAELVAFLAAARDEGPRSSTARDGHEALRVAVAATRSHVEGRTVRMDEV
jgi:myo-inositol 2-dehydrogenase/D-chiro-inositol 1-dehydrogenase